MERPSPNGERLEVKLFSNQDPARGSLLTNLADRRQDRSTGRRSAAPAGAREWGRNRYTIKTRPTRPEGPTQGSDPTRDMAQPRNPTRKPDPPTRPETPIHRPDPETRSTNPTLSPDRNPNRVRTEIRTESEPNTEPRSEPTRLKDPSRRSAPTKKERPPIGGPRRQNQNPNFFISFFTSLNAKNPIFQ